MSQTRSFPTGQALPCYPGRVTELRRESPRLGLDPVADTVIELSEHNEAKAAIAGSGLTHREAIVVFSYFTENKTDEQISANLGISRSLVSRIRRGAQDKIARALPGGDSR